MLLVYVSAAVQDSHADSDGLGHDTSFPETFFVSVREVEGKAGRQGVVI